MAAPDWNSLLGIAAHRPYPLPSQPWAMHMSWHDLLFAHWPVPSATIQERLPRGLELDTFDGTCWLGIVPFRMTRVGLRILPPWLDLAMPELNVRTYVTAKGRPGVWFFSLDAASALLVAAGRSMFHLPYFRARMSLIRQGDEVVCGCERTHRRAPALRFEGRYAPSGGVGSGRAGTLEHFLTERYCLYAADRRGRLYRSDIHHVPWPLESAAADLACNEGASAHGLALPPRAPLLHFARRLDVIGWMPEWIAT